MNCQEYPSRISAGLTDESAWNSPPPAFSPLSWLHVINQPDSDPAGNAAPEESATHGAE
jgi:hypothetical protein